MSHRNRGLSLPRCLARGSRPGRRKGRRKWGEEAACGGDDIPLRGGDFPAGVISLRDDIRFAYERWADFSAYRLFIESTQAFPSEGKVDRRKETQPRRMRCLSNFLHNIFPTAYSWLYHLISLASTSFRQASFPSQGKPCAMNSFSPCRGEARFAESRFGMVSTQSFFGTPTSL